MSTTARIPDPTLMARLQLSVKGLDWAASLVQPYQHHQPDGRWSAHQHVYHLLGVERILRGRIEEALREDQPRFPEWDEAGYMATHRPEPDITLLADEVMAERGRTFELLRQLAPEQWFRTAVWPDGRTVDVAWMAERALWQALYHFQALIDLHGRFEALQAERWRQGTVAAPKE
ncbi:hypothetical protein HRbin29_00422 [bacterium HR29]|jgi:hypothetical protein|nr:hypothetical protein HRbin29_00422 [bacterium HR29]